MTRVAVLGTGKMGGAIARRLKTGGFNVSVWDRKKSKAEALDVGRVAESPADAVGDAEVVVSIVTCHLPKSLSKSGRRASGVRPMDRNVPSTRSVGRPARGAQNPH